MLAHSQATPHAPPALCRHRRRRRRAPWPAGAVCSAHLSRRHLGASTGAALLLASQSQHARAAESAAAAPASPLAALFAEPAPAWPGPSFAYVRQLLYPSWLFGEWACTSTLVSFDTPRGRRYVPDAAVAAATADTGRDVSFRCRFYSTLPDTASNALRVTLGGLPQSAVVADRAFNIKSLTDATLGTPDAVASVAYDPRDAPLRVSVVYAGTPPMRAELYLSALRGDDTSAHGDVFHTAECIRQVSIGVAREAVSDYQIVCRFQRRSPDDVLLTQKVCVYLTPQDAAYFDVASQAVGVYSYTIAMARQTVASPDGGGPPLACVETPKAVVQCA